MSLNLALFEFVSQIFIGFLLFYFFVKVVKYVLNNVGKFSSITLFNIFYGSNVFIFGFALLWVSAMFLAKAPQDLLKRINGIPTTTEEFCEEGSKLLKKNPQKAKEYFEIAIQQGSDEALAHLGEMYLIGKGVKRDLNKAYFYFKQGDTKENITAQLYLGYLYIMGLGVRQDIKKGKHYLAKVAPFDEDTKELLDDFNDTKNKDNMDILIETLKKEFLSDLNEAAQVKTLDLLKEVASN